MILSEKTPIQIGAVILLASMASGMVVFLAGISSSIAVNAVEIKSHDDEIRALRNSILMIQDIKTDVAVIREKVERLDHKR